METSPRPIENNQMPPEDSFENEETHEEEGAFVYELLKGHSLPDGSWRSGEELRMEYLHLTDKLIQTMLTEKEIENHETGEKELRRPSVVIFLDKSARPLSHLVRALWPVFAKDPETDEIPPMPAFRFLNIDREQWVNEFDPKSGKGIVDVGGIHQSIIRGLRAISLPPSGKEQVIEKGVTEEVDTTPTALDNEFILVVDETYATGNTTKTATGILGRAHPSAHVQATHWMQESYAKEDGTIKNGVPVWYNDGIIVGRGIGNRYTDSTTNQKLVEVTKENYYRTIGRLFLSSPLQQGPDRLYLQLIREFKELATNPDVPIMPSYLHRDERDIDNRLIAYNFRDVDVSQISDDEREALIAQIVKWKNDIHEASKREEAYLRLQESSRKTRR